MPTLSFVLSAVLVGSGALYLYLGSSQKIEKTKQKIEESRKVEYLSKKTTLKLSTVSKTDINKGFSLASLDGTKISEVVALDSTVNQSDKTSLDKLQKAMQKVMLEQNNENPTCGDLANTGYISQKECESLKTKQFTFYKTTSSNIELPQNSTLAKDTKMKQRIEKKIISSKNSSKLVKREIKKYKRELIVKKKVKRFEKVFFAQTDKNKKDTNIFKDRFNKNKKDEKKTVDTWKKQIASINEDIASILSKKSKLSGELNGMRTKLSLLEQQKNKQHRGFMSMMRDRFKSLESSYQDIQDSVSKKEKKLDYYNNKIKLLNEKKQKLQQQARSNL